MIKVYSNQNSTSPQNVHTTEEDWWMIFDPASKNVIVMPQQCSGYTSSPLTMVVAENKDELNQYIIDNSLIIAKDFRTLV
jgi:hypothetical protein